MFTIVRLVDFAAASNIIQTDNRVSLTDQIIFEQFFSVVIYGKVNTQ